MGVKAKLGHRVIDAVSMFIVISESGGGLPAVLCGLDTLVGFIRFRFPIGGNVNGIGRLIDRNGERVGEKRRGCEAEGESNEKFGDGFCFHRSELIREA